MNITYSGGLISINHNATEKSKAKDLADKIVAMGDHFVLMGNGDYTTMVRQTGFANRKEFISGLRLLVNKCKKL